MHKCSDPSRRLPASWALPAAPTHAAAKPNTGSQMLVGNRREKGKQSSRSVLTETKPDESVSKMSLFFGATHQVSQTLRKSSSPISTRAADQLASPPVIQKTALFFCLHQVSNDLLLLLPINMRLIKTRPAALSSRQIVHASSGQRPGSLQSQQSLGWLPFTSAWSPPKHRESFEGH